MADEKLRWIWARSFPVKKLYGQVDKVAGIAENITEQKKAEEIQKQSELNIKASIQEKESLLKEIHHRVKNNIQTVISLLRLQYGKISDDNTITILKNSENRIRSMALIHEQLYQSENLARIAFADYIKEMARWLSGSYSKMNSDISFHFELDNIILNLDTAIPLALVVNELITNSLKYAFPDSSTGQIDIFFAQFLKTY